VALPVQFEPVEKALHDCISLKFEAASRLMAVQGGRLDNSNVEHVDINGVLVPYWYVPEKVSIVTRTEAEKTLGQRLAEDAKNCTLETSVPGFTITPAARAQSDVRIADAKIIATVAMPVTVKQGDTSATIESFEIDSDASLGNALTGAQQIADQLAKDKNGLDLTLQLDMPTTNTIYNYSKLDKIVLLRSPAPNMVPDFYDFAFAVRMADVTENRPPIIEPIPRLAVTSGQPTTYQVVARDPEGSKIKYDVLSAVMTIDDNGLLTINEPYPGNDTAIVRVTDRQGLTDTAAVGVDVA
jgi:hypothetical protein